MNDVNRMESTMKISDPQVYQFKATLRNIAPPIWRRIQVCGDYTLDQLHGVLQVAMGWENYHEYEFLVARSRYRVPDSEDESKVLDARQVRIRDVFPAEGAESEYIYDFGDYWQHDLQFEYISTAEQGAPCPRCLDGGRSCPPEDVGGFRGYQDYLAVIADPSHEAYEEMTAWQGAFDPEAFSIEKVNQQMEKKFHSARERRGALRPNAAKYESSSQEERREAVAALPAFRPWQRIPVWADESVSLEPTQREGESIQSDEMTVRAHSVSEVKSSRGDHGMSATHKEAHGRNAVEDPRWSQAEKKIARKAFDLALKRELQTVMAEVRKRAEKIKEPSELWNLEHFLTECRKRIDRQFDYRYSVLIQVFGELLQRNRLSDEDLQGLSDDKLIAIRRFASFLSSPLGSNKHSN
jgi:Plasmid pRiA4b ORF-3-like protein/Photoprotection regulator fluorescence recovery protein